jgi:hypothetical protein
MGIFLLFDVLYIRCVIKRDKAIICRVVKSHCLDAANAHQFIIGEG